MLQAFKRHIPIVSSGYTNSGDSVWRRHFYLDRTAASLLHSPVSQLVPKVSLLLVETQNLQYLLLKREQGN